MLKIIRKIERGSALIEVSLTIPVIVIFIVGIWEFGKYFSQMSWLTQTSYNSALVAGENVSSERYNVLQERYDKLAALQERTGFMDANNVISYDDSGGTVFADGSDYFEAEVSGTLQTRFLAFMPLNIPVRSTIIAPIMILGDTSSLTGTFRNPSNFGETNYGCDNTNNRFCRGCVDSPCTVTTGNFS